LDRLFEIWLEGDHYKWRSMRTNGVAEKYVTGKASPEEKFLAWAVGVKPTTQEIFASILAYRI
jgi:glucuronate isomerase